MIQEWLQGKTRDIIAKETGISQGSVTGIITEWKERTVNPDIENLREFAIWLKNQALRLVNAQKGLGMQNVEIIRSG
ncbi:hypothetical protein [Candidatus Nitrosocosmicus arcticus]|uniref:HTH cro/C1-type domain-containing protein n=1 Tax=Candidatus Nitrosocosmicus arcticus TaxID=2035267 RepID=A0A557SR85_9ARCH|nr:hypothetical protein [Candidatus Nitrosocosmicus arcticus]TVP39120.1 hypothetical protein NARC_200009 [Candidatus Nitrosocosmicus arcticus]